MKTRRNICCASCAIAALLLAAPVFAVDDADLLRRQSDQKQARVMAQQLVSSVLDLQMRQLEENGLTDLPVYADIRAMRGNLATLVDREMAVVVERLVEAQNSTGAERDAKFVEARRAIREVVIRLSVERQTLMRRLKAAEIAEQARRLLEMQITVRESVVELSTLPIDRRPEAALRTIEDQQDVSGVFGRLMETLAEVKTWDGDIATAASEGQRMLKASQAEAAVDAARAALAEAKFDDAVASQATVIEALKSLIALVEQTQDATSERSSLIETVRRLKEEQQLLREAIREYGLTEPPQPEVVEAQQKIARTLDELSDQLVGDSKALPLREQAATAAKAATEALFTADEERTLTEQQRVVDRLEALEEVLSQTQETRSDRSAAELAALADELEATRDGLKQAVASHQAAVLVQATNPEAASGHENAASEMAGKVGERDALPSSVASRIADAAEAAQSAAQALKDADADAAKQATATEAMAESSNAFQRAQAAVEEALADVKRAEAAVRIGEFSRAAEALERAAAAERELGMQAAAAAQSEGISAEQAAEMSRVQSDVATVAAKAAEGVADAAPEVKETLAKATEAAKQAAAALAQAAASPGEPSKPSANAAAEAAQDASKNLTEAAASLRKRIGETATELAELSGEQLQPIAAAQQAVQAAAESAADPQQAAEASAKAANAASQADVGATSAAQAATQAAAGQGTPQDVNEALDRAAISLAAREQKLQQDQQFASQLGELAGRQQGAANAIAEARQGLEGAPTDPGSMTDSQKQAARSLHSASRQFAAAQRATGQGAAQVSGQQQIANVPIREALQTAERLPVSQLPDMPAAEPSEVAEGAPNASQQAPQESGDQASDTAGNDAKPGDASQQAASSGAQGQNAAGATSSSNAAAQATGLGTGLIPAAPDETARMMAGPEAQAALAAMEAAGMDLNSMEDIAATDTGDAPPEGQAGEGPDGNQQAAKGDSSEAGSPADSDSQTAGAAGSDAKVGPGTASAGWFAKLPPDVRAAIRASSSQPAPKGYEGRLRRYFESVDE